MRLQSRQGFVQAKFLILYQGSSCTVFVKLQSVTLTLRVGVNYPATEAAGLPQQATSCTSLYGCDVIDNRKDGVPPDHFADAYSDTVQAYLDDFDKFCQKLGGATAEIMGDLLSFEVCSVFFWNPTQSFIFIAACRARFDR